MKVLISAYACEPNRGSEPAVGWHWALEAARRHEVWVITRSNNRSAIEEYGRKHGTPPISWVYVDLPALRRFKRGRRGLHFYYYLWQVAAYLRARRLHNEVGFDLVNHVTFVTYWMPSFMSLLPAPFIWGPVGGAESAPPEFYPSFGIRGRLFEHARDLVRAVASLDPFVRLTARRARLTIAVTRETAQAARSLGAHNVHVLSQVGLSREELDQLTAIPIHRVPALRFISVGALLHLKGFHLALLAFAHHARRNPEASYVLIGDGPERSRLERLAERLGLAGRVTFMGQLSRPEVLEQLSRCDVMLHPTLHDSGGFVCLESMAAGRPVICLDLGGPAAIVPAEAGVRVTAGDPDQAVEALASAMDRLSADEALRLSMAAAGREHVSTRFTWSEKGQSIDLLYSSVSTSHDLATPTPAAVR